MPDVLASIDVGTIVVSAVGTGAGALVTWAATVTIKEYRSRKTRKLVDNELDRKRDERDQQVLYSIIGTPATEFSPRIPGLQENQVATALAQKDLQQQISDHKREDVLLFRELHEEIKEFRQEFQEHISGHQ